MDADLHPDYSSYSSITLQTDKKGFFLDYADCVAATLGDEWLKRTFAKLKTDEERIMICFSDEKVRQAVQAPLDGLQPLHRPKSADAARQKRAEGLQQLNLGRAKAAVALLSQSVIRAPYPGAGGEEATLALSLEARAEALREGGDPRLALGDLQLALRCGYPDGQAFQLYWRMARCWRELGEPARAAVALRLALRLLAERRPALAPARFAQHERTLRQDLDALPPPPAAAAPSPAGGGARQRPPEPRGGRHPQRPGLARCVGEARSPERGRYNVLTEAAAAGSTLACEQPYAAVLLPALFASHCHHCFGRLRAPVGCRRCSGLAFCGPECRDAAAASYHGVECGLTGVLLGSGMSPLSLLALRMATQASPSQLAAAAAAAEGRAPAQPPDEFARRYAAVHALVRHEQRRPPADFLQRTLMAVLLLRLLAVAGYFPAANDAEPEPAPGLSRAQLTVGALLLRWLQLLQFNAHELFETLMRAPGPGCFRGARPRYIGVGLYPAVALCNHDCYPAVARFFVGRTLVLQALRPLAAGEPLPENYGPAFVKFPAPARARTLQCRYWFRCACRACAEDWPQFDRLDNGFRFRCPSEGCGQLLRVPEAQTRVDQQEDAAEDTGGRWRCRSCGRRASLREPLRRLRALQRLWERGLEAMEAGEPAAAVPLLCAYTDGVHALGSPPHRNLHLAQEALRACLAHRGNTCVGAVSELQNRPTGKL